MILKKGFSVLLENEKTYFLHLEGLIKSVDINAEAEVTKNPYSYAVRIVPSMPDFSEDILKTLENFHTLINIEIKASKSIKRNGVIFFTIDKID